MYQAPEQLMAWNKANLEAAVRFAGIALEGAERMLEVQLKAAKSAFADGVQQAKMLADVKDPQEFAQLKNTLAQPSLEKATSYVKSVYDVAAATQSEINKLVEEQVSEFNKQVVTGLDKVVKSAPAGSEMAVAAVKSAISAVNSTYDNLSKSAKQFAEMSQANIEAVWEHPDDGVSQTLPARVFMQLTRILREAVSNVIKHSAATHCEVHCTFQDGALQMMVKDDGRGIAADLHRGQGMSSMKRRAKKMSGQCLVESRPGFGVVISLTVPL